MRYLTLAERFAWDAEPVKGSRFRAVLVPVRDAETALAAVRAEEAAHPALDRIWDAAEPRGSAGRPILQQLEGHAVFDVAAVVLRHFGGTKLGVGGLMRAYGGAAGMALDRARVVEVAETVALAVSHGWGDSGAVEAALAAAGAEGVSVRYDDGVHRVVRVDADAAPALITALRDRTAGRVRAEPNG